MEYFRSEVLTDNLTVDQILLLGGSITEDAMTEIEVLERPLSEEESEYLLFAKGTTPEEDWDSVEEWGMDANSKIILTEKEFQALPLNI